MSKGFFDLLLDGELANQNLLGKPIRIFF